MKKGRLFSAIIYFIFTFGIGIIFSLTLPGYFATFTIPSEVSTEALADGDFITAIALTEPAGFFKKPVIDCKFDDGGGVILYETVMEVYDRSSSDDASEKDKLSNGMFYKSYTGYVYGVSDRYEVFATENNGTVLTVTTRQGQEVDLPLLDYDSDGNGSNDGISTYTQNGFIILEIREGEVSSLKKLSFKDKTGTVKFEAETEQNLDFQSEFFDCFGDINGYNALVARVNDPETSSSERDSINSARNDYVESCVKNLKQNADFVYTPECDEYKAAVSVINGRANKKAIPFIIVYFVAIYVIADFLLGSHYIIKFFRWFLFTVCKIPRKNKKSPKKEEVFGHDYYSMVTLRLDVSEVPEFNGGVEIKYTNSDAEVKFTLLKEGNYTDTQRIKAGVYVNPFIDINRDYAPLDLPDNLEIDGFQVEKVVKIAKRQ